MSDSHQSDNNNDSDDDSDDDTLMDEQIVTPKPTPKSSKSSSAKVTVTKKWKQEIEMHLAAREHKIKEKSALIKKLQGKIKPYQEKIKELHFAIDKWDTNYEESAAKYDELEGKFKTLQDKYGKLKTSSKTMIDKLQKHLGDGIQAAKANQQTDVLEKVKEITKSTLFRKIKFIIDDEHLLQVTESALQYLTIPRGIEDITTWKATYAPAVTKTLSDHRGYIQSEARKRAERKT